MPKKELHYRSRVPPKRTPSTAHTPSKKINAVSFDETNLFNVPIPEGMEIFTGICNNYIRAILAGSAFDTSRPCVACGKTGHAFDGCPILNNIKFLRRHFIGFQLFNKRHSNDSVTAPATVNQLHAEPADKPLLQRIFIRAGSKSLAFAFSLPKRVNICQHLLNSIAFQHSNI